MEFLYTKVVKNGLITNKMPSSASVSKSKNQQEETFDKVERAVTKYEGEDPKTFK